MLHEEFKNVRSSNGADLAISHFLPSYLFSGKKDSLKMDENVLAELRKSVSFGKVSVLKTVNSNP